jgi:hypothetical protein
VSPRVLRKLRIQVVNDAQHSEAPIARHLKPGTIQGVDGFVTELLSIFHHHACAFTIPRSVLQGRVMNSWLRPICFASNSFHFGKATNPGWSSGLSHQVRKWFVYRKTQSCHHDTVPVDMSDNLLYKCGIPARSF